MKVSIIIPVYNAARHIDRCLESLRKQTYRNLEVLFVDDCSTDNTIDKIKAFIESNDAKDLDIKILFHDRNRGVAAARNTALDSTTGDYVYSLDADDYMDRDTIELMVKEAERTDADVVGIEWMLTFEKNGRHMAQPDVKTGDEMFRKMCRGVMRWNLWLFMMRRIHIEEQHLRFTEGMNMGEDMMLMLKMSLFAKKVSVIHQPLYHYVNVSTSVSKVWSEGLIGQINHNVAEVERFLAGRHPEELSFLKLNQKLPLLVTGKKSDYEAWQKWFPEANVWINQNKDVPLRTRLLQMAAAKHQFWYIQLYYFLIVRIVYGVIYR